MILKLPSEMTIMELSSLLKHARNEVQEWTAFLKELEKEAKNRKKK